MLEDEFDRACKAYKAGQISYKEFNAAFDAARAQEEAEEEREKLMRELRRQNKRKNFISVSINIPLD